MNCYQVVAEMPSGSWARHIAADLVEDVAKEVFEILKIERPGEVPKDLMIRFISKVDIVQKKL